ncbi:MAG: hypothetical protein CEN90_350 [Parcubacteria group bacterium Licking1014_17]|nr:MAG: hypothetical protein CEN90_350 [Parcubacteria group bacterium Licking1014_17]
MLYVYVMSDNNSSLRLVINLAVELETLAKNLPDKFFSEICFTESRKIADISAIFVTENGKIDEVSSKSIGYYLDHCLSVMYIMRHLFSETLSQTMIIEKDLLLLKLVISSPAKNITPRKAKKIDARKDISENKPVKTIKKSMANRKRGRAPSDLQDKIIDFISKKGRVQNSEVYTEFKNISRRTIQRKISELLENNVILKEVQGKSVFYFIPRLPS